jgi:hypothetical protein
MHKQLGERSNEVSMVIKEKLELKAKLDQISSDYEREKQMNRELSQEMTRHCKGMQEELLMRIKKLEETVLQIRGKVASTEARQDKIIKEKDLIIQEKEDEIMDLRDKMEDMADEFSQMLKVIILISAFYYYYDYYLFFKDTLDKMRERIEISTGTSDSTDIPVQRRIEEIKLGLQK